MTNASYLLNMLILTGTLALWFALAWLRAIDQRDTLRAEAHACIRMLVADNAQAEGARAALRGVIAREDER